MDNNRPPKRHHPFSIASLLSILAPPPKRPRFFIENLLASDQSGSGTSQIPKDYVTKIDASAEHNQKFKVGHYKSQFSITELPIDPEALLAGIFQQCIDEAIEIGNEKFGVKPDRLGCLINSSLLHTPIYTQSDQSTKPLRTLYSTFSSRWLRVRSRMEYVSG